MVLAGLVGLVGACAQQGTPPGGPEDRRPPVVVATTPDTFALVQDFSGAVRFDFDERISERVEGGALNNAVLISPRTGAVRVRSERRSILVELEGGFRPGVVYRITLLPVVSDLFSNRMRDPFELVFSTGPTPVATTIAGVVWDRVGGGGAADYEVLAQGTALDMEGVDTTEHVARTDTGGVYAFRFIPAGRYTLTAYEDRNRNSVVDVTEVQGTARQLVSAGDTLYANIAVLQPDTTQAIVTSAEPLDSVTLLIEFDDYLDPDLPLLGAGVALTRLDDSTTLGATRIFHEHEYLAFARAVADSLAVLDSIETAALVVERAAQAAADSAAEAAGAADTSSVPFAQDTAVSTPPQAGRGAGRGAVPERGRRGEGQPPQVDAESQPVEREVQVQPARQTAPPGLDGRPVARTQSATAGRNESGPSGPGGERLPSQSIVAVLSQPLERNVAYQLRVTVIRNISGIPLGGGEAAIVLESLASRDSATVGDTATAAVDSTVVSGTTDVVDTTVVIDTLFARPRPRR